MDAGAVIAIILLILPFVLGFIIFRQNKRYKSTQEALNTEKSVLEKKLEKYSSIIDLDEYKASIEEELHVLKSDITISKDQYDSLKSRILILDEEAMMQEYGIYKPIFNLEDSEQYKKNLLSIQEEQKEMLKSKLAATCSIEWTIDGSKAKGAKATSNNIKLALRAFNGECDAAIAKVKYNNVVAMQNKIQKSFDDINKAMESNLITIKPKYLQLKLDELNLTYELREKQYQEKEEQRRIKEEMREEEKAQRELEKAQKDAEQEELKYQKALEKARLEVEQTTGLKHDKLMEQISKLEAQLLEAQAMKQRAMSMAQMTRSGHVYVISNIGSFGENVYKIGMTRRLEPLDRVKELGDASVPFSFDVHAMIFNTDAPALEKTLHRKFVENQINKVNPRKEFFNIGIIDIKNALNEMGIEAHWTMLAEAREYNESKTLKHPIAFLEYEYNKSDDIEQFTF